MKTKKESKVKQDATGDSATPEQRKIATKIATAIRSRDSSEWDAADGVVEFVGPEGGKLKLIELKGLLCGDEGLTVTVQDLSKWLLGARIFPPGTRVAGASFDIHRAAAIRVRKGCFALNVHRPDDKVCEATRKKALPLIEEAVKGKWNRDQTRGGGSKSRSKPVTAAVALTTTPALRALPSQGGGGAPPAAVNGRSEGVPDSEPLGGAAMWFPARVADMLEGAFARMKTSEEIVELLDAIVEGCEGGFGQHDIKLPEAERKRLADKFAEVLGVGGKATVAHQALTQLEACARAGA